MRTIKLPVKTTNQSEIIEIQKHSSKMFRLAYNRFWEHKSEKDIRELSKTYKNIELLDSWFIQSAIKKAEALLKAEQQRKNKKKTCFGGYINFCLLSQGKLSKEDFELKRLSPIFSQGEACKGGNRKFIFDIDNNQIIFKYKKNKQFILQLPKLRKNLKINLMKLQEAMVKNQFPITIELKYNEITITYDETILKCDYKGNKSITAGIDLNPNFVGFSISNFKNGKQKIIFKQAVDLSNFTKNLKLASNHKKSKHQVNKQHYELIEISRYLISTCKRYNVDKFIIEDLNIKSEDKGKGSAYNRLCNNKWNRNLLINQLEKRCNINNIDFIKINPCYTSYIGNILHNEFDPIASSIEITRRGFYSFKLKNKVLYRKDKFYPALVCKETLENRWKEALNWIYESWIELCKQIKTSKLKYRHSLEEFSFKVCRFRTNKSFINLYSFI